MEIWVKEKVMKLSKSFSNGEDFLIFVEKAFRGSEHKELALKYAETLCDEVNTSSTSSAFKADLDKGIAIVEAIAKVGENMATDLKEFVERQQRSIDDTEQFLDDLSKKSFDPEARKRLEVRRKKNVERMKKEEEAKKEFEERRKHFG